MICRSCKLEEKTIKEERVRDIILKLPSELLTVLESNSSGTPLLEHLNKKKMKVNCCAGAHSRYNKVVYVQLISSSEKP